MTRPALSVVVPSIRHGTIAGAVTSIRSSAGRAGVDAQVIVAWQGEGPPPELGAGVEIVRAVPAGVSVARNAGLARAVADVVAFIDDDETVAAEWVAGTLRAFADARVTLALGQVLPADGPGVPYCEIRIAAPRLLRGRRRAPWDMGTGGNMALRREALRSLGGFDIRLGAGTPSRSGEDTDVIARLQAAGAVIALWPEMVAFHPRKTPAELSASRVPYGRGMGVLARRRRSAALVVSFLSAAYWALRAAVAQRSARRALDLAATTRGWAAGMLAPDRWDAPPAVVARAPGEIRAALGSRAVRGLPVARRGDPHFVYAAGEDRLLHVHTGDPARVARGIGVQRALDGHPGVPRVVAAIETEEAHWSVEARVPGRPADLRDPRVAAWFAALARRRAGAVGDGAWWAREAPALAWLGPAVGRALERLREHPAAPAHGAPRAGHVLLEGDEVAVLGWEEAEADAPAGLDVVALALEAGEDPGALLERAGLPADTAPALVTVTLAHLVAAERRRAAALGAPPPPPRFAALL